MHPGDRSGGQNLNPCMAITLRGDALLLMMEIANSAAMNECRGSFSVYQSLIDGMPIGHDVMSNDQKRHRSPESQQ